MATVRHPEAVALLRRWSYKPGWEFVVGEDEPNASLTLRVTAPVIDVQTREPIRIKMESNRFWDTFSDEAEFFKWIRGTVHQLEHHEMDEWAKVDGVCMETPHPEAR